jgi:ankyrin repeat protein
MKVLIPILIGLLVGGCDRSDSMSQAEEDLQQKAGGNGENGPSVPGISIHEAAEKGDLEAIKKHITAGTNINSTEWRDGETPLHRAITRGQTEAAKLLIEKGCNINLGRTKDGETPLDMA